MTGGRGWAYAGLIGGALASIVGNVADVILTPAPAPTALRATFAFLAPVFLFVSIEVLIRVNWQRAWYVWAVRTVGMLFTIGVSAYVSFGHLSHLAQLSGRTHDHWAWPLMIDGVMAMGVVALLMSRPVEAARATLADKVREARTSVLAVRDAFVSSNIASDIALDTKPADMKPVRRPRWDVREVLSLLDGHNDEAIAEKIGTSAKTVQRVRAVVRAVSSGRALPANPGLSPAVIDTIVSELRP